MAPRHSFIRNHSILGLCNWFSNALATGSFPHTNRLGVSVGEGIKATIPPFFPLQERRKNTRQGDLETTRDQAKANVKSPSGASRPVGWRWWDISQKWVFSQFLPFPSNTKESFKSLLYWEVAGVVWPLGWRKLKVYLCFLLLVLLKYGNFIHFSLFYPPLCTNENIAASFCCYQPMRIFHSFVCLHNKTQSRKTKWRSLLVAFRVKVSRWVNFDQIGVNLTQ